MKSAINRRRFGAASAAILVTSHIAIGQEGQTPDAPWFDPSYGRLPTTERQVEGLDRRALAAQINSRAVSTVAVTGLPANSGSFDRQVVAKMREGGHVGLTLCIAIDGQLAVTRGDGVLSSHDPVPATPTSPGFLGSLTKPLCAMSALTLVKQRKLDLESLVLDVLPLEPLLKPGEIRQPEIDRVTVRMLMNHTSGLFNVVEKLFDRPYYAQLAAKGLLRLVHHDVSQYDLVRRGMSIRFVSHPGTEAHYSGQGLQVLGRIIERLSGRRLDQFMYAAMLRECGGKHHATMSYLSPETCTLGDCL